MERREMKERKNDTEVYQVAVSHEVEAEIKTVRLGHLNSIKPYDQPPTLFIDNGYSMMQMPKVFVEFVKESFFDESCEMEADDEYYC